MFGTVKGLTTLIDKEVKFVNEAKINHSNFTDEKYNEYISMMKTTLSIRLKKLRQLSSNAKLITKYEIIIKELFQ